MATEVNTNFSLSSAIQTITNNYKQFDTILRNFKDEELIAFVNTLSNDIIILLYQFTQACFQAEVDDDDMTLSALQSYMYEVKQQRNICKKINDTFAKGEMSTEFINKLLDEISIPCNYFLEMVDNI